MADRTVHCTIVPDRAARAAFGEGRIEIARYDRAGLWYYEHSAGYRRRISLGEAVEIALSAGKAATWHEGLRGGKSFDSRVRAARKKGGVA